ncbi:MAG: class F sortase [Chloroflexi bacterium]|nr:MAG: class F sortase [Chloroflexota bacterium]
MLQRLRNLDRRIAIAAAAVTVSALLLIGGLAAVFLGIRGEDAGLPHEGNIEQLLASNSGAATPGTPGPPAPAPVRFVIPSLNIDAPVVALGVTPDGFPDVPERPDQVAWYPFSAPPGQSNNAVFSGHVDWQTAAGNPIAGVFYRLREMKVGETMEITLDNGAKLTYRVVGNVATQYDDPKVLQVMDPTDRDVVTIITCGGTWIRGSGPLGGNYSHRIIVRGDRVQGLADASLGR